MGRNNRLSDVPFPDSPVEFQAPRDTLWTVKVTPPTNPFHLARAYGVTPASALRPNTPVEPVTPVTRKDGALGATRKAPTNIDRLVAGVVPGSIDFTDESPRPATRSEAIPLYRHPADLNAAATSINAGRTIDVCG